jgi:hypothetical protein
MMWNRLIYVITISSLYSLELFLLKSPHSSVTENLTVMKINFEPDKIVEKHGSFQQRLGQHVCASSVYDRFLVLTLLTSMSQIVPRRWDCGSPSNIQCGDVTTNWLVSRIFAIIHGWGTLLASRSGGFRMGMGWVDPLGRWPEGG